MKKYLSSLLPLAGLLLLAGCAGTSQPLPTATQVDLSRYAGRWYEIARLPNAFQRDDSSAIAEYTPQADGSILVRNTELRPDGSRSSVEGRAKVVADSANARLKVSFGGFAALVPVNSSGNYWIIDVAPDYSVALVGTPDRRFLWLLARQPKLSERSREKYLTRAKELGFPVEKVIRH